MAIIKQYHKDTDTTYVYESTSYWDAEKGQSRSKRRVIGKVDPETGEIIPTGKRGRSKKETSLEAANGSREVTANPVDGDLQQKIVQMELTIHELKETINRLESENKQYKSALAQTVSLSNKIAQICSITQPN